MECKHKRNQFLQKVPKQAKELESRFLRNRNRSSTIAYIGRKVVLSASYRGRMYCFAVIETSKRKSAGRGGAGVGGQGDKEQMTPKWPPNDLGGRS